MLKAVKILINQTGIPSGLEDDPVFTILAESDQYDCKIAAWRLIVAKSRDFAAESIVWDSTCREAADPVGIPYRGRQLEPHRQYHVKAMVWDNHGQISGWSEPCQFDTAFFGRSPWQASFILADFPAETAGVTPCFLMARDFALDGEIELARLYITARGVYEASLNGRRISDDVLAPGFMSYRHHLAYQSYDLTGTVRPGQNRLSVLLGDGWYKGYLTSKWHRNYYGDRRELLCELHIRYKDGRHVVVASDGQFGWKLSPVLMSEIYSGEICDGGLETADEDDGSGFRPVRVGSKPAPGYLHPSLAEPMRYQEKLAPQAILHSPKGETIIDFGIMISGTVELRVRGQRGDKVVLQCGDVLDQDGNFYNDNLELFSHSKENRRPVQMIEYRLAGSGEEIYRPHFSYQGFRYVNVLEFPGQPAAENFSAVVITSFTRQTGFFNCSDPEINALFANIIRTQRGNFMDLPIAGPQRAERLGWTGDAQLFAPTACRNMFDAGRFFAKWLEDMRFDQRADGLVGAMIPYVSFDDPSGGEENFSASSAWGDAAIIVPSVLYTFFEDAALTGKYCEMARRHVEYMRTSGDNEYLFTAGYHFGDWFALDNGEDEYSGKTGKLLIASCYYCHSAVLLAGLLDLCGRNAEAESYRILAEKIKQEIGRKYFAGGRLLDATQTGCTLVLSFGIAPDPAVVFAQLVSLLEANGRHLDTGFIGTSLILQVLCDFGRPDLAYDLLLTQDYPSWIYPISRGATTVWEHWNSIKPDGSLWSPNMNSFSHMALASVGEWLYGYACGLRPAKLELGWREFLFSPVVDRRLEFAQARFQTVRGEIGGGWRFGADGFLEADLSVPVGAAAIVTLPRPADSQALALQIQGFGCRGVVAGPDDVTFSCGSGRYKFKYQYADKRE